MDGRIVITDLFEGPKSPHVEDLMVGFDVAAHATALGKALLSSLPADAGLLNEAARSHWAVENSLHWVLDVTFDEDGSRIRKENAPENFGLLRRLALCLLKRDRSSKGSIKGKRLRASWDEDYLLQVLCGEAEN